jgi:hypothetical protein
MKLGIAVRDLGASQLNFYIVNQVNALVAKNADKDAILFFEEHRRPCLPMNFAVMQMTECFGFNAPVVATTVASAEKLLRLPGPTKRIFYVWDLEWLRFQHKNFRALQAVYGHPSLLLIARSGDHKQAIEQAWNRPVDAVIENFNLDAIMEVVNG